VNYFCWQKISGPHEKFQSPRMLLKTPYLQYSECSPLLKIQHEATCGCYPFRIQMNFNGAGCYTIAACFPFQLLQKCMTFKDYCSRTKFFPRTFRSWNFQEKNPLSAGDNICWHMKTGLVHLATCPIIPHSLVNWQLSPMATSVPSGLAFVWPTCDRQQQNVAGKRSQWLSEWVSSVLRPLQHSIDYTGDGFYR